MHRLLLLPLLLAGVVAVGAQRQRDHSHHTQTARRKSLGFGPILPHAVFRTQPDNPQPVNVYSSAANDPFVVAGPSGEYLLGDSHSTQNTYVIRDDSYTDKNTGVSHIYIRQIVNGLEVADGDINVNIKNGAVISHGNSVRMPWL